MDWTTIIVAVISSGTLLTIFTLSERKKELQINNVNKINEQWEKFAEHQESVGTSLKAELDAKNAKIDALYDELSLLREKADKLSSRVAYLTAFKCQKINCAERVPPFGHLLDGNNGSCNSNCNLIKEINKRTDL